MAKESLLDTLDWAVAEDLAAHLADVLLPEKTGLGELADWGQVGHLFATPPSQLPPSYPPRRH